MKIIRDTSRRADPNLGLFPFEHLSLIGFRLKEGVLMAPLVSPDSKGTDIKLEIGLCYSAKHNEEAAKVEKRKGRDVVSLECDYPVPLSVILQNQLFDLDSMCRYLKEESHFEDGLRALIERAVCLSLARNSVVEGLRSVGNGFELTICLDNDQKTSCLIPWEDTRMFFERDEE